MEKEPFQKGEIMNVNLEQQKVISNPLRSQMIALLYEEAMTPKELADAIGKNPGTVYYHIQQLVKHDIVEVESTRTDQGIVQKLYRAKANYFRNPDEVLPENLVDGATMNVYLSKELLDQLSEELKDLFYKYGHLAYKEKDQQEQAAYLVKYLIEETKEEDE